MKEKTEKKAAFKKAAGKRARVLTPKPTHRPRGRPAGADAGLLDKQTIHAIALQLAKSVPLIDLSIIRVAKELGVTPALIHYYLGGRDALTSGVMNSFFKELVEQWPVMAGHDWQHHLEVVSGIVYRAHIRYPGVAAYVVSHNRFRMVQAVEKGETDYGILYFERFMSAVRAVGFDAERTGTYAHLLVEFITTSAHATVRHMWPGDHRDFLQRTLSALDPAAFPAIHFVGKSFTNLNSSLAFTTGLRLFIQGLELELKRVSDSARSAA